MINAVVNGVLFICPPTHNLPPSKPNSSSGSLTKFSGSASPHESYTNKNIQSINRKIGKGRESQGTGLSVEETFKWLLRNKVKRRSLRGSVVNKPD